MNTKDLSGIAIMIRIQLLNTEERKLMIGKADEFLGRSKKPYIL